MKNQSIALDLKVSRRKAGLLQADVAHLLATDKTRISHFENGRMLPSIGELSTLSIVYGKSLDALLSGLIDETVDNLVERRSTLPKAADGHEAPGFNRAHTLSELSRRLEMVANRPV